MPSLNGIFPHYHTMGKLLSECSFSQQSLSAFSVNTVNNTPITKIKGMLNEDKCNCFKDHFAGILEYEPCQLAIARKRLPVFLISCSSATVFFISDLIASHPHQLQLSDGVLPLWLDCQSSSTATQPMVFILFDFVRISSFFNGRDQSRKK